MASVFSPVFPTITFATSRVQSIPLKCNKISYFRSIKCNKISYFRSIKCSNAGPLQLPFNGSTPMVDASGKYTFRPSNQNVTAETLTRGHFPSDFVWGVGTSAIQIEGDGTEGGRGPSTGDYLIKREEGGKGVNSYYMYKDDVELLKNMNMPFYRFSIAWPRILPDGTLDNINPEGIEYYHKLLDELEKNNITPMATLLHFDMPQALQDKYNGFFDRRIIKDFTNYADLCFKTFGHRIKHWITINEMSTFLLFTDCLLTDEQKRDGYSQYICAHNMLLAHASAYRLYEKKYKPTQQGEVGNTVVTKGIEPHSESPEDAYAEAITFDFVIGIFLEPVIYGDYPENVKNWASQLLEFTEEEKNMLRGSFDFIGVNYYFGQYVEAKTSGLVLMQDGKTSLTFDSVERFEKDGVPIGPMAPGVYPIYIYPPGLKKLLYILKNRYNNPRIYVTETGCSSKPDITMSVKEAIEHGNALEILGEFNDDQRLGFIRDHLFVVYQAMLDNVNIHGFIGWSLLDNQEFGSYEVRFGFNFVDYFDNFKRYPKKTALWFKNFLGERTVKPASKLQPAIPFSGNDLPVVQHPVSVN